MSTAARQGPCNSFSQQRATDRPTATDCHAAGTDVSGWNAEQRAEHHITNGAGPPLAVSGYRFDQFREYLSGAKSLCASSGIDLQTIAMGGPNRSVTLGLPERDAEIEVWCELLRAMGEVGVTNVL